jgi:hypothetical protein
MIRRVLIAALAALACGIALVAFNPSPMAQWSPPAMLSAMPTPASGCSQATTFLARGTFDGTHTSALTTAICGFVADGTWTGFDFLYFLANQTVADAKLNLVSTSFTISPNGSPTFTADRGYSGLDASTDTLSTGLNSGAGSNATQNSASIGIWVGTSSTGADHYGAYVGDGGEFWLDYDELGNGTGEIFDSQALTTTGEPPTGTLVSINRSGSAARQIYQGGTSNKSDTRASTTPGDVAILIRNEFSRTGVVVAAAFVGRSFSSTEQANIYSRINTYLAAVGGQ